MRKYGRILATIMVMMMLLVPVMGVSAAKSSTAEVTVSGDKYDVATESEAFKDFETSNAELYNNLVEYNKGTVKLDELIKDASDTVKKELEGKTPVTKLYDLVKTSTQTVDGKHKVTLTVPALTDDMTDVVVLHYNNGVWEVVEADVEGKTLTVELDSLGVFGIYASLKTSGGDAGGSTAAPTGGTNSTWMIVVAVALVAVGAGVLVSQKKRA